ncbi:CPBP family intramembrane glutamic endopeptidase [Oscillatoria sp. FACHB-1406]|uniref:CPBP family intramembrane glutamic endopeptidase n=1 Tax=Oscillatoria sp. FACHB-1406 TaxID=2692846 RepID=UPI00168719FF|nr:CPBP family intramembrane glutamic endopeptidase [Oscillatoria sp. FACHB-1406]MBD2576749.1 CPBP family intramembrane metalloprotease [Oscillatoria sp. FACHB-1406]
MAATALLLLTVAKVWQYLGSISILSLQFSPKAFLIGVGLALAITISSGLLYQFWADYRRSANYYLELVLKPLVLPDYIWLGLLPGMSEELLFRGVMLPALGANTVAVVLSSVLFGILHLSGTKQWPYAVWATAIGLTLGFSAILTGNLLVPIIAHVLTNFLSGCLWKLNNKAA